MLLLLNYIIKVLICQYFLSLLYAKIPAISHWNFCFRVPILGHPHNYVRQACRLTNRWKSVVEVYIANHIEKHKLSIVRWK